MGKENEDAKTIYPDNGNNIAVVYVAQSGNVKVGVVRETVGGAIE